MHAERARAAFEEHGIAYDVHEHAPAMTAQEMAAAEHRPGWEVAKPVFIWAGGELVMVVMPAPLDVDLEQAAATLGVHHVRLATEVEFTTRFPDCQDGAEVPFGNLYDMPVYAEERLLEQPRIAFAFGRHDQTATIAVDDYVAVARPTTVRVGTSVPH